MSRAAFSIIQGGAGLGQVHSQVHRAPATVVRADVEAELSDRGYSVTPVFAPHIVIHEEVPVLTKAAAIRVAVDEAIDKMGLPKTASRPYYCPSEPCYLTQANWDSLVNWSVTVANGFLSGRYDLPRWAQMALESGQLSGLMGLSGLGAVNAGAPGWLMPVMVGGGVLLLLLLMKK